MKKLALLLLLSCSSAFGRVGGGYFGAGQQSNLGIPLSTGSTVPSSCVAPALFINSSTGNLSVCAGGVFVIATGATIVATGQTNVYGAFLQDFTTATMEVPEAAGFTANVDSTIGLDTTNNNFHIWANAADAKVGAFTITPAANNNCLKWVVAASNYLLGDLGQACGTVTVVGAGSLTSTALVTGGGAQTLQTPSATSTLSAAGALQVAAGGSFGTADTGAPTITGGSNILTFSSASFPTFVATIPGSQYAAYQLSSGATSGYLYGFGPSYTTSGRFIAASTLLDAGNAGGLGLSASQAGGIIKFWTAGDNERARIDASGNFGIGSTTTTSMFNVGTSAQFQVNSTGVVSDLEGAAPSGTAGRDLLHADSTNKAFSENENNTGEKVLSRSFCINTTPVTVSANVTTDQNLMACTLSANQLNILNRTLKITTASIYSTPAASVAQMTEKIKLCTVSGCGSGVVVPLVSIQSAALGTLQITNNAIQLPIVVTTQTTGASSTYEAHGCMTVSYTHLTLPTICSV